VAQIRLSYFKAALTKALIFESALSSWLTSTHPTLIRLFSEY